jgi:hypothetical protein
MKKRTHHQRYWKKENLKIDKSKYTEIVGNRVELKKLVGKSFDTRCYITNSYGYTDTKRLVTEVILPISDKNGKPFYVKHVWCKTENIGRAPHGYNTLKMKVTQYTNQVTGETKYSLRCVDTRYKMNPDTLSIKTPEWKKELKENEKLKKEVRKAKYQKKEQELKEQQTQSHNKIKHPFGKIRKITQ